MQHVPRGSPEKKQVQAQAPFYREAPGLAEPPQLPALCGWLWTELQPGLPLATCDVNLRSFHVIAGPSSSEVPIQVW